MFQDQWC